MLSILSALSTTVAEHQARGAALSSRPLFLLSRPLVQARRSLLPSSCNLKFLVRPSVWLYERSGWQARGGPKELPFLPLQMSETQFSISTVLPVMTPVSPSRLSNTMTSCGRGTTMSGALVSSARLSWRKMHSNPASFLNFEISICHLISPWIAGNAIYLSQRGNGDHTLEGDLHLTVNGSGNWGCTSHSLPYSLLWGTSSLRYPFNLYWYRVSLWILPIGSS